MMAFLNNFKDPQYRRNLMREIDIETARQSNLTAIAVHLKKQVCFNTKITIMRVYSLVIDSTESTVGR